MKNIFIDLETYSDIDLQKCGVYKYVESPNFEILLFGYSIDGAAVKVIDLAMGENHTSVHTYWTQAGRLFIYSLMKADGYLPLIEQEV